MSIKEVSIDFPLCPTNSDCNRNRGGACGLKSNLENFEEFGIPYNESVGNIGYCIDLILELIEDAQRIGCSQKVAIRYCAWRLIRGIMSRNPKL